MRKIPITILLITTLLLVIQIATAVERLTVNDFKEPSPSIKISGKYSISRYAEPGERVEIKYVIEPRDEDCAKKLDNRYYEFISDLENVEIKVRVFYKNDGIVQHPIPDKDEIGDNYLKIELDETEYGVEKIVVNVTGIVPEIDTRYKEIKAIYFDISDADENVLPEVELKVYNISKFNKDVNTFKGELKSVESDISYLKSRGYDVTNLSVEFEDLKKSLDMAEEYLKSEDYKNCNEKLSYIESNLDNLLKSIVKLKANAFYVDVSNDLNNISSKLKRVEELLMSIANYINKSTYSRFKNEYKDLKDYYDDVKYNVMSAKSYIDLGNYDRAVEILKEQKPKIRDLISKCDELYTKLTSVKRSGFDILTLITRQILLVLIPIIVASALAIVLLKRRRKGKWDELG